MRKSARDAFESIIHYDLHGTPVAKLAWLVGIAKLQAITLLRDYARGPG